MSDFKPMWVFVEGFYVERDGMYCWESPRPSTESSGVWVLVLGEYDGYRECLESERCPNLKYYAIYLDGDLYGVRKHHNVLVEEESIDSDISDKYAPQVEAQWSEVLRKVAIARTAVENFHSIGSGYNGRWRDEPYTGTVESL